MADDQDPTQNDPSQSPDETPSDPSADAASGQPDAAAPDEGSAEDAIEQAEQAAGEVADQVEESGDGGDSEASAALAAAMAAINMSQQDANDAVEQAMLEAMRDDPGEPSVSERSKPKPDMSGALPLSLSDLASSLGAGQNRETLDLLSDVQLKVRIELGRTRMYVEDILQLGDGAVVELDKLAGDPVDVFVNERHVARGEVLVLNDNFCIRVNEILDPTVEDRSA